MQQAWRKETSAISVRKLCRTCSLFLSSLLSCCTTLAPSHFAFLHIRLGHDLAMTWPRPGLASSMLLPCLFRTPALPLSCPVPSVPSSTSSLNSVPAVPLQDSGGATFRLYTHEVDGGRCGRLGHGWLRHYIGNCTSCQSVFCICPINMHLAPALAKQLLTLFSLFQIHRLAFAVINSTTIHLPAWQKVCHNLQLTDCLILCDVRTHWDSTYDMLVFVLDYHTAIDSLTSNHTTGLRAYKLNNTNWHVIKDLQDVLKVCHFR